MMNSRDRNQPSVNGDSQCGHHTYSQTFFVVKNIEIQQWNEWAMERK